MVSSKQTTSKKKFYKALGKQGSKLTAFIKPMLAKETDKPFNNKEWLYEIKWDGYRAVAEINKGDIKLYSRNGNSFNLNYPIVVNELKKIKQQVVLDGEIVILDENGKSDFQKLQDYENNSNYPIGYYIFDLLAINGKPIYDLPLIDRKKMLRKIIPKNPVLKYSDHVIEKGIDFFTAAKEQDLEGIMAKKIASQYHPGSRSNEWLKIKHHKSEDVIVTGFTKPTGSRQYFGALVLAVNTNKGLKYIGHTGSGFTDKQLKEIYALMKPMVTNESPFKETVKTNAPVTWIKPTLIAEIKFTEWTTDGHMRHPIFLRLRDDKSINDMIKPATKKQTTSKEKGDKEFVFGKIKVPTTNPGKLYWPDEGITKGMMLEYYQSIADYILPYLKDRPESLKRNPNGIANKGFFHKDAGGDAAPDWVKSFKVYSESANKEIDYIVCNDKATLAYLNNLGCIELNPWSSTIKSLDKPDYMIIDIDPSEKNSFEQVIETALAFKKILDKAGAAAYCKTSGATGLHIYVPMGKKYSYEQVKSFAEFLCTMVQELLPAFTSMDRSLAKRGKNKIYLDYLQNRRGQTIAAPYSLRPYKGATVSTPLLWKEVKPGLSPATFTINNTLKRVTKLGDLFKDVLGKGIDLKACLTKLS